MEKEYERRTLEIKEALEKDLENINNNNDLVQAKAKYLWKSGIVTELTKNMKDLSQEERVVVGKFATNVRNLVNELITEKDNFIKEELLNRKLKEETIDITLPSKKIKKGSMHPFNKIVREMEDRYDRFCDKGVKNITTYNEWVDKQNENLSDEEQLSHMPYIVVIVDELADLMLVASKEV